MYDAILVPLDGSPFAEFALGPAAALAEATSGRLRLVCVQDPVPTFAFGEWDGEPQAWRSDYLEDVVDRITGESDVGADGAVRVGPVTDEILDEVEESGADLVVLATHGRGPVSRFWLGSVADGLVRNSRRPVLLIRPEEDAEPDLGARSLFRKILVPLDRSEESEAVLPHVRALAGLADAEILLHYVVHFPTEAVSSYPPDTFVMNEEVVEETSRQAEKYLAETASALEDEGWTVDTRVRVDVHPASGILETARKEDVDLVAMSTHGRGGLGRTILGSVTDKVVRAIDRPVLTVRPDQE